ncbi:hypothetical protein ACWCQS_32685 [Streptomyces sp. NPDC002076]
MSGPNRADLDGHAAATCPDGFDAPDRFDITRRPNRHIALGSREHFCIGALLARAEMKNLFSELLDCLDSIEQAGPAIRLSSVVVNGLERLPIRMVSMQP